MANQTAVLVRVPTKLAEQIARVARENDRSINAEVRRLLMREFTPKKEHS